MRKRKVLSFFTFLGLFAIGLAAFNVINFGSMTGKVVAGEDYTEELFMGSSHEFRFYPSSFEASEGMLEVRGELVEIAGIEHNLQVTSYAFDSKGEVIGTSSSEIFLGAGSDLALHSRTYMDGEAARIIMYVEDERTSVKIYKELEAQNSPLTGRVTAELDAHGKTYGSFAAGLFIFGSLLVFVVYKISEYKKSLHLDHALSQQHGRHFIDLDVR